MVQQFNILMDQNIIILRESFIERVFLRLSCAMEQSNIGLMDFFIELTEDRRSNILVGL